MYKEKLLSVLRFLKFLIEITLGILFFIFLVNCDNHEVIIENLSQHDTYKVLALFQENNIEASKEGQKNKKNITYNIKIKKSHHNMALSLLVENNFPKAEQASFKELYATSSSSIMPSKNDELGKLVLALQGESENLLKMIPGIIDAHVVYSMDPIYDVKKSDLKRTASVVVIYHDKDGNSLSPISDDEIKELISGSFGGLNSIDVKVLQRKAKLYHKDIKFNEDNIIKVSSSNYFLYSLMIITTLALIIAAYGVLRLFIQKRASL